MTWLDEYLDAMDQVRAHLRLALAVVPNPEGFEGEDTLAHMKRCRERTLMWTEEVDFYQHLERRGRRASPGGTG